MPPFPELKDITPPTPPPLSSPEELQRVVWLIYAVVVTVAAVVVLWLWWRARARRRRPPPLPLSALEEARRRLSQLETLAPQLEAPALGQQVCEVLRHFLERQHGVLARYRTTEELLGAARNRTIPPLPFLQPFAGVLHRCDDLKFAGAAVPGAERSALVREALSALVAPPPVPARTPGTAAAGQPPPGLPPPRPPDPGEPGMSPPIPVGDPQSAPAPPAHPDAPLACPVPAPPWAAPSLPPGPPPPPALAARRAEAFTHRADSDRGTIIPA